MAFPSFVAVVGLALGLAGAGLTWAFGSAPGWREYRRLSLMMLACAAYCGAEMFETIPSLVGHAVLAQRVQLSLFVVYSAAQYSYFRAVQGEWRFDRIILVLHASTGLLALVALTTNLGTETTVVYRVLPYGGMLNVLPRLRPLGNLLAGLMMVTGGFLTARCVHAWRKGDPFGLTHVLGTGICLAAGLYDFAVFESGAPLPFLMAPSFCVCIILFAIVLTRRFIQDALALEQLSMALGSRVSEHSAELVVTRDALEQAERSAALGRIAAGVAHEINNPAAAVTANLEYLLAEVDGGRLPPDGPEALRESIEVMGRIRRIVRQLLDAGRVGSIQRLEHVRVGELLKQCVASVSRSEAFLRRPRVTVNVVRRDGNEALEIVGRSDLFLQVLGNLLVNAAQAYPIAADREGDRLPIRVVVDALDDVVGITVEDEGSGIPADVLQRIFEPFFTTQLLGEGTGLGLAVTIGIVRSMDGSLDVESRIGQGTRMRLTFRRAHGDAPPARIGMSRPSEF